MSDQVVALGTSATTSTSRTAPEINTAADLARFRAKGKTLTASELKELTTKVKALEEIAKLEDRLRILENRKRTSDAITSTTSQEDLPMPTNPSLLPDLPSH